MGKRSTPNTPSLGVSRPSSKDLKIMKKIPKDAEATSVLVGEFLVNWMYFSFQV